MPLPTLVNRRVALPAVVLALAVAGLGAPAPAFADPSQVTIVGTSDVYDSGLVTNVLGPDFQKANPGYTLNYVSKGSKAAIKYAEAGTADGLLVHAASLENQFVGGGYSVEQYGRALFYGDFVLLGPTGDPAGVKTTDAHDIVGAFERIASQGTSGHAHFVSRNDGSGTNVQEHVIWSDTSGVPTCTLDANDGGGTVPSTTSGTCPDDVNTIPFPSWYKVGDSTNGQAANVEVANTCPFATSSNDCYVLTDRGTYDYLESQNEIPNLQLVSSDNSASAPGGRTLLANSFHGYAVNSAAVTGHPTLNTAGALAFLNWVTSASGQADVGAYLANEPTGAPFLPDAAPKLTVSNPPTTVKIGKAFTLTGALTNKVPGTPALSDKPVDLLSRQVKGSSTETEVASATTDSTGHFSLTVTPQQDATYSVSTGPIVQTENASLTPPFGDLLQAATTPVGRIDVQAAVSGTTVRSTGKGRITVQEKITPAAQGNDAHVSLYARRDGASTPFAFKHSAPLSSGARSYTTVFSLPKGKWQVQLHYVDAGYVTHAQSSPHTVAVR